MDWVVVVQELGAAARSYENAAKRFDTSAEDREAFRVVAKIAFMLRDVLIEGLPAERREDGYNLGRFEK